MKNWKTTLGGLLTAVGLFCTTNDNPIIHLSGVVAAAIGAFLTGAYAKDHNTVG